MTDYNAALSAALERIYAMIDARCAAEASKSRSAEFWRRHFGQRMRTDRQRRREA